MTAEADALVEDLDRALDAVLAVRVALGGSNLPVPDEALDEALHRDDAYQQARRRFSTSFAVMSRRLSADDEASLLDFASAVNSRVSWLTFHGEQETLGRRGGRTR